MNKINSNIYDITSYKETIETSLDIKKMLFNTKNQAALSEFIADSSKSKKLTINSKPIEKNLQDKILSAFENTSFIDLSKEPMTEDVLLNRVKDGIRVEVKNNFDIYTFELGQENIFCTVNGDEEHAYFMKSSYEEFGRVKGGVEDKYTSFKNIIDTALSREQSKLELLQSDIDKNLNALADKLDSPETAEIINQYLKRMSAFHNYSFSNQMLLAITAQERDMNLERVASFNTWRKLKDADGKPALIRKGEKGLPVIVPITFTKYKRDDYGNYILNAGNKIPIIDPQTNKPEQGLKFGGGFVFDISQLDNEASIRKVLDLEYRDTSVDIAEETLEHLIENISNSYSVAIRFEDIKSGAKAYFSKERNEIVISNALNSNAHILSSLFHELGHKLMHSEIAYDSIHKNRGEKEGEAEAFSKILSNLYGIDNPSELYIKTWGNSGSDIKRKLEYISSIAMAAIGILGLNTLHKSISEISFSQSKEIAHNQATRKPIEAIAQLAKTKTFTPSKKGYSDVAI